EFGHRDLDVHLLRPGQRVWKTDDPELTARLRKTFEGPPRRTVALDCRVRAVAGEPLVVEGRTGTGFRASVVSESPLAAATSQHATEGLIREQFGRLGGTSYHLGELLAEIEGGPMVPKSLLNELRRGLVARLDELAATIAPRAIASDPVVPALRAAIA